MRHTMACQTELVDRTVPQQPRIRRSVRRMASHATFSLHRSVFIGKRPLLVYVALNAGGISASRQPGLFKLKTTVRIVTITALHGSFKDLMVEGLGEIGFCFTMATHAKLRLAHFQHSDCCEARLFGVCRAHENIRAGYVLRDRRS